MMIVVIVIKDLLRMIRQILIGLLLNQISKKNHTHILDIKKQLFTSYEKIIGESIYRYYKGLFETLRITYKDDESDEEDHEHTSPYNATFCWCKRPRCFCCSFGCNSEPEYDIELGKKKKAEEEASDEEEGGRRSSDEEEGGRRSSDEEEGGRRSSDEEEGGRRNSDEEEGGRRSSDEERRRTKKGEERKKKQRRRRRSGRRKRKKRMVVN